MVIGKITSIGSLFIIGAIAILFLRQASATSFGHAGQDVGSGLTGISSGISNLFNSFINPIAGLFGSLGNLFQFGLGESSGQSQNNYGYVRDEPADNTSRINSQTATEETVKQIETGGGRSAGDVTNVPSGVTITGSSTGSSWSFL